MSRIAFLVLQDCRLLIHFLLASLSLAMDQSSSRKELIREFSKALIRLGNSKHVFFIIDSVQCVVTKQIDSVSDSAAIKFM